MNFTVEIKNEVDVKAWNNTLSKSTFSTAMQTASFQKYNEFGYDSKLIYVIVYDATGQIAGQLSTVLNFSEHRKNPNLFSKILIKKLHLGSNIIWKQGPIIHDLEHSDEIYSLIFSAIDKIAKENNIEMIKGTSVPLGPKVSQKLLEHHNYKAKPWTTYIIPLNKDYESYFDSLDKSIRYDIRKSEKNNLIFEIGNSRESLYEFAELKYTKRNEKNKISNDRKSVLDYLWDNVFSQGYRKLFLVRDENHNLIGGINCTHFNHNATQTTVINSSKTKINGGSFLIWNTLKWNMEHDFSNYNMGGVNPNPTSKKEQGIKFFKSKWKGQQIPEMIFTKIINRQKRNFTRVLLSQPNIRF